MLNKKQQLNEARIHGNVVCKIPLRAIGLKAEAKRARDDKVSCMQMEMLKFNICMYIKYAN